MNEAHAVIALGANLANTWATLRSALSQLALLPQTRLLRVSGAYVTAPQEVDHAQPDYLNAAALFVTQLTPHHLLEYMLCIEREAGRTRPQWHASRTLDLDLIAMADTKTMGAITVADAGRLSVPHPRAHTRAFVLAPMCEIAPEMVLVEGKTAAQWLPMVTNQRIARAGPLAII